MAASHISEQMRGILGGELGRQVSYPITDSDIRRWALAVYYPEPAPPLFWDAEYAAGTRHGGIVAPEEFNPFAWAVVRDTLAEAGGSADTPEKLLGTEGPSTEHMLNGGIEEDYGVRMHPGDVITSVTTLHSYSERSGRLGLMLFTIFETTWTNQDGEFVKRSRNTLIRY